MVLDLLFILRSRHFCISSLFTIRSAGYFPSLTVIFPSPPVTFPPRQLFSLPASYFHSPRLFFLPADTQCAQAVIFPPHRFTMRSTGYFSSLPVISPPRRFTMRTAGYFSSPPIHNMRSAGNFPPRRSFFLPADFIQFLNTLRLCDLVPSPLLILRSHIRYLKHVCSS